ncbi:hypothetical protein LCGC14_0142660 [marine sediment metagenome]|uniref:Uncharacterized protein n=1 Tax=marine sediment metagenome TaxID=412755 RepID=A0A0F9XII8_9ZZZZ
MDQKQIKAKLREILNREDIGPDSLISRKKSAKHEDDIEVLLEHLSLLVKDLGFDVFSTRNELFQVRSLLES